jgi:hypothetical protein
MIGSNRIAIWTHADRYFKYAINQVNHDDLPFDDIAEYAVNYAALFPDFQHYISMLQDAIDRKNPAYTGRAKWRICGEIFYVVQGQWRDMADGYILREDSYLHAKTGETYTLEYSFSVGKRSTAKIDNVVVFSGVVESRHDICERGVNRLLCKVDALPF